MRLVVLMTADGGRVAQVTRDGVEVTPTHSSIEFLPKALDGYGGVALTLDLPEADAPAPEPAPAT